MVNKLKFEFYAHSITDKNTLNPKREFLFSEDCNALIGLPCGECKNLSESHGHLNKVAYYTKKFSAAIFRSDQATQTFIEKLAYIQGLWHDLGKYSEAFQERLRGGPRKPDHATAGARQAVKSFPQIGLVIAYGIAGHHSGLPNTDSNAKSSLKYRLLKKDIPNIIDVPESLLKQDILILPDSFKTKISQSKDTSFTLSLLTRFLFSCLIDADYLASEAFMNPKQFKQRASLNSQNKLILIQGLLNQKLEKFPTPSTDDIVNIQRAKVLENCIEKATYSPGLFTLTVPTGGGKTLSSFKFAVDHAIKYNKQRIIYVVPFTSIIEQNAKDLREIVAPLQTKHFTPIVEHHSALVPDSKEAEEENLQTNLATENWDAPIIITTAVQFYESLFASKTARSRKVHNIANSVIILDEAQTLPVNYLKPCLETIRALSDFFDSSIVLCTATQPAINRSEDFDIGLDNTREIIDDVKSLFSVLKRVEVEPIGTISDLKLSQRFKSHDQVLCIVNRRQQAQDIFEELNVNGESAAHFHLSALMCPKHRSQTLEIIKSRLKNNEITKVISTQLIEAGVDIDFPVVYRSMAGLDSIAQAAGRCNRNGRLKSIGKTYIFEAEDSEKERYFRDTAQVTREVMSLHEDLLSPQAVEQYFDLYYYKNKDRWDQKKILENFQHGSCENFPLLFQFKQASKDFKLIENDQVPILIQYDEKAESCLDTLRNQTKPINRDLLRKLQPYTVNIPKYLFEKHMTLFEPLRDGDFYALCYPNPHYSNKMGLILDGNSPHYTC